MSELTEVLSQLKNVKKVGDEWQAICPAHPDKNPSLSVTEKGGRVLIFCHAGCSFEDIMAKLKIEKPQAEKVITNTYDYVDESYGLLYQVVRYEPKSFRQRRPDGKEWIWDLKGVTPVLYSLPDVIKATEDNQLIYLVEGEKDADNLIKQGLTATTMSGGSKAKWQPQYTEILKDAMVVLIPDDDGAGYEWANRIGGILYGWVKMLKVLELSFNNNRLTNPGQDITNWLQDHTIKDLEKLVLETEPFIPEGAVTREEYEALKRHIIYLHNDFIKYKAFRKKDGRYIKYT